jgi:ABC-type multidrug transport system ATPase subunit
MRQVLCSLTLAAHPRILFVDEGFGSLDKENFEIVCKTVLPNLASHFEKVVIISHNPSIHKHTTTNCAIKHVNGRSQLQFGQIAYNGVNLRVQDDHQQYTKNMRERKDEANIINATDREHKRQSRRIVKIEEERDLLQHAVDTQSDYGESIIEATDDKMVRCMACNKEYKNRNGFAASHIKTKAHMKCMQTFE